MGFFNELSVSISCSNCSNFYESRIQFKFGATRQLQYKVGDKIIWGYNEVGIADIPKVKVYGIVGDDCPICGNGNSEFDIFIEQDIIVGVADMKNRADYLAQDGRYAVLGE